MLGNGIGIPFQRKVGGGFVGLLDEYSGAAFAASVRLLRADYTGGLLRARANDGSTDQGEADVLPYDDGGAERFVSLDSRLINLDATAVTRGLTTSDTLGDLLDVGTGNYDGFVPTIFDQSIGGNNLVQTLATRQGIIATGGVLEVENGKPIIRRSADANGGYLASGLDFISDTNQYGFHYVGKRPASGNFDIFGSESGGSDYGYFADNGDSSTLVNNLVVASNELINGSTWNYSTRGDVYDDLVAQSLISAQIQFNFIDPGYTIGYRFDNPFNFGMTDFEENVIFDDNSQAAGVNTNINNAFSIYP